MSGSSDLCPVCLPEVFHGSKAEAMSTYWFTSALSNTSAFWAEAEREFCCLIEIFGLFLGATWSFHGILDGNLNKPVESSKSEVDIIVSQQAVNLETTELSVKDPKSGMFFKKSASQLRNGSQH